MDVERTIGFLLAEAARHEARMARHEAAADARLTRLEQVVRLNNRVTARLVRYGVSLRSDVRRLDKAMTRMTEAHSRLAEAHSETDGKLNALIDTVDKMIRRNGSSENGRRRH